MAVPPSIASLPARTAELGRLPENWAVLIFLVLLIFLSIPSQLIQSENEKEND